MVWFSHVQDEIIFLRSQQKSSHDDNRSTLKQLEVRPGLGETWESLSGGLSGGSQEEYNICPMRLPWLGLCLGMS